MSAQGGGIPACIEAEPSPVNRMTNRCKNITLAYCRFLFTLLWISIVLNVPCAFLPTIYGSGRVWGEGGQSTPFYCKNSPRKRWPPYKISRLLVRFHSVSGSTTNGSQRDIEVRPDASYLNIIAVYLGFPETDGSIS